MGMERRKMNSLEQKNVWASKSAWLCVGSSENVRQQEPRMCMENMKTEKETR